MVTMLNLKEVNQINVYDTNLRHGYFLSESSTQGVRPGKDHPVLHSELKEGVPDHDGDDDGMMW